MTPVTRTVCSIAEHVKVCHSQLRLSSVTQYYYSNKPCVCAQWHIIVIGLTSDNDRFMSCDRNAWFHRQQLSFCSKAAFTLRMTPDDIVRCRAQCERRFRLQHGPLDH